MLQDGTQIADVRSGREGSPAFEKTYTDMLGRTIRTERPGFGGALEVATNTYDDEGHVASSASTGSAPMRFEYDELALLRPIRVAGNPARFYS